MEAETFPPRPVQLMSERGERKCTISLENEEGAVETVLTDVLAGGNGGVLVSREDAEGVGTEVVSLLWKKFMRTSHPQ